MIRFTIVKMLGGGFAGLLMMFIIITSYANAQDDYVDPGYYSYAIDVKFIEGSKVRLVDSTLVSYAGFDMCEFYSALEGFYLYPSYLWIFPLFERPVAELEAEHEQAELAAGEDIPDLTLFFRIFFGDPVEVKTIIEILYNLEVVEYARQVPLPMLLPTPDFSNQQGYLGPALQQNVGLDIQWAWAYIGGKGKMTDGWAVTVVDIEYDWNFIHEDVSKAAGALIGGLTTSIVYGNIPFTQMSIDHGTAVIGMLCGDHQNPNIGIHGFVPDANLNLVAAFWQNTGYNLANSINLAQANTTPGDVILIEQQIAGPNYTGVPQGTQLGLVPVEWNQPTYAAILTATALGRVIIEAAGNGQQNLNGTIYQTFNQNQNGFNPFNRTLFNSGAIIVGAGVPTTLAPEWFTNFGSRIDMHAWGSGIVTTGYGDFYKNSTNPLNQNEWYTNTFGGTSGASPMITGCAVALQGINMGESGVPLSAQQIRTKLLQGATPQTNPSMNIGPRPNMKTILASSIKGMVFDDSNVNGLKDAGESGLSNWTINLNGQTGYGKTVNLSTATDASGSSAEPTDRSCGDASDPLDARHAPYAGAGSPVGHKPLPPDSPPSAARQPQAPVASPPPERWAPGKAAR